jgi:hypothetical protein
MHRPSIALAGLLLASSIATSIMAPATAQQPPRPCAAIRQACQAAGFVANGAREGNGVVVDCIRPIMQGAPQRKRASKPLPTIDPALVEACKAQNPNFGVGNAQGPQRRQPRNAPGAAPEAAPGSPSGAPGPAPQAAPPQAAPPPEPPAAPSTPPPEQPAPK